MMDFLEDEQLPRWRVIEETLKREILEGQFNQDRQLPADTKVAERFGVSRLTARKALASLRNKGFIRIEHGRGAFVENDVVQYRILQKVTFTENVVANNKYPSRRMLRAVTKPAPLWVSEALGLLNGTSTLAVTLLAEADGRPLALSTSYLEQERFDGFDEALGPDADVDHALRHYGISKLWPGPAKVIARMPTDDEARLLDQSVSRPIVEKTGSELDAQKRPVWCHVTTYAADRVQFIFDPQGSQEQ
ncbi:GntR family transcriptional regulator [Microvirga sp. VF16]|uniref:GntR family transcriptional regulator n=1 Tax=Microvirga sp. VF16 TaxID=2807101 RepID=UPI00193D3149|nr:UTRA domain-containing protein [Microvirga sp. VF16]QRM32564.1 UTRA domain-containing protein [Microvirga sp. VF16]